MLFFGARGLQRRQLDITTSSNGSLSTIEQALEYIPRLACQMVDAEYGALAIMNEQGEVARFIVFGMSEEQAKAIGDPPRWQGAIGGTA